MWRRRQQKGTEKFVKGASDGEKRGRNSKRQKTREKRETGQEEGERKVKK